VTLRGTTGGPTLDARCLRSLLGGVLRDSPTSPVCAIGRQESAPKFAALSSSWLTLSLIVLDWRLC
jgi:hypothetical protein